MLGPDDHRDGLASDDPAVRARLAIAGRPVPGIEVEVRDDDGASLAAGEAGELWVRGPQVSGEYLGLGTSLDADGWFPTRDRAWIDADGYLFIEGRTDDTIIRGGENIAPAEVEDVLVGHPAYATRPWSACPTTSGASASCAVVVPRRRRARRRRDPFLRLRARLRGSRTPDAIIHPGRTPLLPPAS